MSFSPRFGRCIYQSQTGITVHDNFFYRWLQFDNSPLQTVLNKFNLGKPALAYLKALNLAAKLQPGSTCLLGLGGAGAAHALSPFNSPHLITVVESQQEVINVAQEFFYLNQIKNLNIIHSEASEFIKNEDTVYQHLLVDIYNANSFPESCFSAFFFARCQQRIAVDGFLTVNLVNRSEQKTIIPWLKNKEHCTTLVLPIEKATNLVLISAHKDKIDELIQQAREKKLIKKLFWDSYWGQLAFLT